jgi:2-iminobutanoate/2-iminopropanoate deaminase
MPKRVTQVHARGVAPTTAPYSHALLVDAGRLLFISGQGPVDVGGNVVGIGDPGAQVRQVFANLKALVEAAGGSLANIVELTACLRHMSYRSIITEVRQELLTAPYPTATMFEVNRLAFDDWLVEISAVAAI